MQGQAQTPASGPGCGRDGRPDGVESVAHKRAAPRPPRPPAPQAWSSLFLTPRTPPEPDLTLPRTRGLGLRGGHRVGGPPVCPLHS